MSILFADIYEAIQNLRIQKGVCEKDILNYIEDRVGGCLKAANFMKTIRTLQKLVDDGVLIKKGKRFVFSSDPPKKNDKDDEDEGCDENEEEAELDMSDDECDEEGQNECEEEGGDEDDEDDDDDDDDDDEDDDDDDDDDEEDDNACDNKENLEKEVSSKGEQNPTETNSLKTTNKEKVIMSPKNTSGDTSGKNTNAFGNKVNCGNSKENNEMSSARILSEETRNVMEQNDNIRRTETIAFCVRDFIDSLYRPKTDCQDQEKANTPDILLQENMDATEMEEIGREKLLVSKKRKSGKKRVQSRCAYRSRSPIKKAKPEIFHSLKRDRSDEVCFWVASNQFLSEPMDADMDIDLEKEVDITTDYDACRNRSPGDPPETNTPGVHVNKKESSCNNQDNKKLSPCFEGNNEYFLKKNVQIKSSQMDNNANNEKNWFRSDEESREQENTNRSFSAEDGMNASVEHQTSLCSFCDKTEINT